MQGAPAALSTQSFLHFYYNNSTVNWRLLFVNAHPPTTPDARRPTANLYLLSVMSVVLFFFDPKSWILTYQPRHLVVKLNPSQNFLSPRRISALSIQQTTFINVFLFPQRVARFPFRFWDWAIFHSFRAINLLLWVQVLIDRRWAAKDISWTSSGLPYLDVMLTAISGKRWTGYYYTYQSDDRSSSLLGPINYV